MRRRCTSTDLFGFATKTWAIVNCLWQANSRGGGDYLENMEALILDHFLVIFQQIHAELQIVPARDVSNHHPVVRAIEQNLSEKLGTLALSHIRV